MHITNGCQSIASSRNHLGDARYILLVCLTGLVVALTGCQKQTPQVGPIGPALEPIGFSGIRWTGVAVSQQGRIFVNYPRWSDDISMSVAELVDGKPIVYPNAELNEWQTGDDPSVSLVCVQSVYIDSLNRLWILDPANPMFAGVIPNGPKLIQVDLETNQVVRTYRFEASITPDNSYLNDVRIDVARNFAFITDSGDGALVVLDLESGEARRALAHHVSTAAEDVMLTIGGRLWTQNGAQPRIHADGIAYDPLADILYYQALTGRTMYRISGSVLRDFELSQAEVAEKVAVVEATGAADGLIFGPDGKVYISALEYDSIFRVNSDGLVETVVKNEAISWPDSFSFGPDNSLYFTTSRIHEADAPQDAFGLYRIVLPELVTEN